MERNNPTRSALKYDGHDAQFGGHGQIYNANRVILVIPSQRQRVFSPTNRLSITHKERHPSLWKGDAVSRDDGQCSLTTYIRINIMRSARRHSQIILIFRHRGIVLFVAKVELTGELHVAFPVNVNELGVIGRYYEHVVGQMTSTEQDGTAQSKTR